MTKQWYKALFENYGRKYESECYAQGRPNLFCLSPQRGRGERI